MSESSERSDALHSLRPANPTWTHVALRVADIDASIAWYQRFTPLRLLDKRQDDLGFGAWLGQPESVERPFILVLAQFLPETDPFKAYPQEVLAPFAHLGIELPTREALDEAARGAEEAGCLAMAPQQMPPPIGYVCMLRDPDGNMIEFSFDQGVYATARAVWGVVSPVETVRSYLASFAGGEPEAIAAHVAADFVNEHASALGRGSTGADEYRSRLPAFLASLPGLRYDVESVIAEGDRIAAEYRLTANCDGHPIDVRGVMIIEVSDGLITRRTDYWDSLTYLRQTGAS